MDDGIIDFTILEDYDFLSETEVDKIYKSYEEALEAGIEEALKHI